MYNTKYMIFTTIGSDVVIQLANLPLLILTPLALTCHAMVTRWSRTERTVLIEVDIVVKRQIDSGLAWSVLLSKTILVITNVKICCGITRRSILTALFFLALMRFRFSFTFNLLSKTMLKTDQSDELLNLMSL